MSLRRNRLPPAELWAPGEPTQAPLPGVSRDTLSSCIITSGAKYEQTKQNETVYVFTRVYVLRICFYSVKIKDGIHLTGI